MTSKTQKIVANSFLGVIGILAIALIIMIVVPVSYSVGVGKVKTADGEVSPYTITVYGSSQNANKPIYYNGTDSEKERYNKVLDNFNSSFSTNALNALFSKQLGQQATYEYNFSSSLSSIINSANSNNQIVVEFAYTTYLTLQKDGKDYVCEQMKGSSKYVDGVIQYYKLWMVVGDNQGFATMDIYVQQLPSKPVEGVQPSLSYKGNTVIKIQTLSRSHNLYETLTQIQKDYNIA